MYDSNNWQKKCMKMAGNLNFKLHYISDKIIAIIIDKTYIIFI